MSLCKNCNLIMKKKGNTFICTSCGYSYKKGEHTAKILDVLNTASFPVTVRHINIETFISLSTIKACLEKLTIQKRVEKHSFKKAGKNPYDYRPLEKGKTPKYYYQIAKKGEDLLKYYKKKGII